MRFVRCDHRECPNALTKYGREKRLQVQICFNGVTEEKNKQIQNLGRDTCGRISKIVASDGCSVIYFTILSAFTYVWDFSFKKKKKSLLTLTMKPSHQKRRKETSLYENA